MVDTEIQALIRQEVQKQVAASKAVSATSEFTADQWDWQVAPANVYPGKNWVYVDCTLVGINVCFVWRKTRAQVTQDGEQPIMPNVKATK